MADESVCIFKHYDVKDIIFVLENIFLKLEKIHIDIKELQERIDKLEEI